MMKRSLAAGGSAKSGTSSILRAEFSVAGPRDANRLGACGLIVVNPPWTLESELGVLLPELAAAMSGARAAPTASIRSEHDPEKLQKVVSPLFHSPGLAYSYTTGFDVPPPVGAGGSDGGPRGRFLSPFVNVRPSRRAAGADGGDSHPWERSFPMAMAGTVKFFNAERGYGFIKPDDGGRGRFVHITAVERAGLKSLNEGQRISFDVEPDKKGKGPKAVNLVITG